MIAVIDRAVPPLYECKPPSGASALRKFIALPEDTLLVLGARRSPPVPAPDANPNTDRTISICTGVGFKQLQAVNYASAAEGLQPDIIVALGDIPYNRVLGNKRIEKATDRQIQWMQDHVGQRKIPGERPQTKLFAPLLPVSCAKQQFYIDCLERELASGVSGLACYDTSSLEDLPVALGNLPRLSFAGPSSPHAVLQHIHVGIDMMVVPFIGAATDAGIALDFRFPITSVEGLNGATPRRLGIDMWLSEHASDVSPLGAGCECYTCTTHHRAYLQHLLAAKEMLGWVLLQIHNHHIMDLFFAGIRQSIDRGTFADDTSYFARMYESQLPEKTGQGPRVRGYQFKAEGPGEGKKNKAAFKGLHRSKEQLAESTPPSVDANADELQAQGFAKVD